MSLGKNSARCCLKRLRSDYACIVSFQVESAKVHFPTSALIATASGATSIRRRFSCKGAPPAS